MMIIEPQSLASSADGLKVNPERRMSRRRPDVYTRLRSWRVRAALCVGVLTASLGMVYTSTGVASRAQSTRLSAEIARERMLIAEGMLQLEIGLLNADTAAPAAAQWDLQRSEHFERLDHLMGPADTAGEASRLSEILALVQPPARGSHDAYRVLVTRSVDTIAGGLAPPLDEANWGQADIATRVLAAMSASTDILAYALAAAEEETEDGQLQALRANAQSAVTLLKLSESRDADVFSRVRTILDEAGDQGFGAANLLDSIELQSFRSLTNAAHEVVVSRDNLQPALLGDYANTYQTAMDSFVAPSSAWAERTIKAQQSRETTMGWFRTTWLLAALGIVAYAGVQGWVSLRRRLDHTETLEADLLRDPLTGIGNRRYLETQLQDLLDEVGDATVMQLDLDHFKPVNDTYGHAVGDKLLIAVAERLSGVCELNGGYCARLGGDEFVAIFRPLSQKASNAVTEELIELLNQFEIEGIALQIGTSIGVAQGDSDAQQLLHNADMALYQAKRSGRGLASTFRADAAAFVESVRRALEGGQILAAYQPQFALGSGRCGGIEVLARIVDPRGTLVPAAKWLDIAEWLGTTDVLFEHLISAVKRDLDTGCQPAAPLWLNIAPNDLVRSGGVQWVLSQLRRLDLPLSAVGLELTETEAIKNLDALGRSIRAIREAGVGVALDDFGARNTPLGNIIHLPVSRVKLDSSLIRGLTEEMTNSAWVIKSMCELSSRLQLELVAEGIESPIQLNALIRLGVPAGQGRLLALPGPLDRVAARVNPEELSRSQTHVRLSTHQRAL
jgi:diguanylate cyclase (GGDEF)-like protein